MTVFETFTGIRPAYETVGRTSNHGAHWTVFLLPALVPARVDCAIGRHLTSIGRRA